MNYRTPDGILVCKLIESLLSPIGYHCALGGSLMYRGTSTKDIDVIVYPHGPNPMDKLKVLDLLMINGFKQWVKINEDPLLKNNKPSGDKQVISVYPMCIVNYRVDIFFMERAQ